MGLSVTLSAHALDAALTIDDVLSRGSCPHHVYIHFDESPLTVDHKPYALSLPLTVQTEENLFNGTVAATVPMIYENISGYNIQYHSVIEPTSSHPLFSQANHYKLNQFAVLAKQGELSHQWRLGVQLKSVVGAITNLCTFTTNWPSGQLL